MNTFDVAIEALKRERAMLQEERERLRKQVSCEHPEDKRIMHQYAGYDVDESGEEFQHLETCTECGAQRMHCDHTKHGKSIGCWMAS